MTTRVYFDSNVFRYLKNKDGKYCEAYNKLLTYKDRIIYYFSYAHLSDLKQDKTEMKFDDLSFMETLVDNNYLNIRNEEDVVNVTVANPSEAFNSLDDISVSDLFKEVLSEEYDENPELKKIIKDLFETSIEDFGISGIHEINDLENPLNGIFPSLDKNTTLLDFVLKMWEGFDKFNKDSSVWRNLRKYSIENLNLKNFDIDINDVDFDEKLKNTSLQKSFLEFVEDTFKNNESLNNQRRYNFFTTAYTCLNMLGLDREKNKKVVFSSFQNDAQHAFYGAHCEYLITDDIQLLAKAKSLYKLFDIETKVLSLDEFIKVLDLIDRNEDKEIIKFIEKVGNVFNESELLNTLDFGETKKQHYFSLNKRLFGYFNKMVLLIEENKNHTLVYYKEIKNYSDFTSFKEIEIVLNNVVRLLGKDSLNREFFNEVDKAELVDGNWVGRSWLNSTKIEYWLQTNPNSASLCFYVIYL